MRQDEYIICAAIWYRTLPLVYEKFPGTHLRPVNCDRGIVFSAHRHLQCLYQMIALTGRMQHEAGEEIQGFLTNKNRFVDREEGAKIAFTAKQIDKPLRQLFSEDLY